MIAAWTAFLGSFILFFLQPFIAKAIMPGFGGGSHVWLTCMCFFQVMLLAGYGYAHLLLGRAAPRRQVQIHAGLLAAALVSLGLSRAPGPPMLPGVPGVLLGQTFPPLAIFRILLGTLGLPALVLAAGSPLLQAWFARARGTAPYRLYAWSNAGSLMGLLAFPFLAEPWCSMGTQAWVLLALMLVYVCGCLATGRRSLRNPPSELPAAPAAGAPWGQWFLTAGASTFLLMAITNALTTEVSGVPLLWVLPLVAYLATFILAFHGRIRIAAPLSHFLLFFLFLASLLLAPRSLDSPRLLGFVALQLTALTTGCLFCHGRLYALRPPPERLSGFYLAIAGGGVLAGFAVSVVAPLVFNRFLEYHLAILLIGLVAWFEFREDTARFRRYKVLPVFACVLLCLTGLVREFRPGEHCYRDCYGQVKVVRAGRAKLLIHGRILHGAECMDAPERALTYYTPKSGIARAIAVARGDAKHLRLGVLGLGVGNVMAQTRAGDEVRFYELSPKIVRIAAGADPEFTVLAAAPARWSLGTGDGRLLLAKDLREGRAPFDVLLADAFSGANVPANLLTLEAFRLYLSTLRPGGILVLNVTNRLPIDRIVLANARALGLGALLIAYPGPANPGQLGFLERHSTFAVLSRDPGVLRQPRLLEAAWAALPPPDGWAGLPAGPQRAAEAKVRGIRPWTDDRNSLSRLLLGH